MNKTIIDNWNSVVKEDDTVFHLGDVRFGKDSLPIKDYFSQLNGNIILIKGSHDTGEKSLPLSWYLRRGKYKFILTHNKDHVHNHYLWEGFWIIHGHSHNNSPLINREYKLINVSVENIDYKPINILQILQLIEGGNK